MQSVLPISNPPTPIVFVEQVSVPPAILLAGLQAPIVTPSFAQVFTLASIGVIQGAAWGAGRIISIAIDVSADGLTFRSGPRATLAGGVWKNKQGVTVTESDLRFRLQGTDHFVRITPNVLVTNSIGFRIRTA